MDDTRTVKIDEIKARVTRGDYAIDADAVAEAFISRMLAVQGANRRADMRTVLGSALDEIRRPAA